MNQPDFEQLLSLLTQAEKLFDPPEELRGIEVLKICRDLKKLRDNVLKQMLAQQPK